MTTRATQGASFAGITVLAPTRVTQGAAYAGVALLAPVRVTQAPQYAGRLADNDLRVTQAAAFVGIRQLKPGCITHDAQCWRIERTDGTVYRFTAHDRELTFRGEVYTPCGSLLSSALQTSSEFGSTENMDLSGVIMSGQITQADLYSGRFDGADVEVWRVDWQDTSIATMLAAGRAGSLEAGTTMFKFEVITAGQRLQQRPILHPVTPTCRFKLGDSRCTVDLEALRVTGAVTSVSDPDLRTSAQRRQFTDTSRAEVTGYFGLGRLTWTGGSNAGLSVDVKAFDGQTLTLETAMQYPIDVGDTYSVVPGCDRRFVTCDGKFTNTVNFGGFPHVRGLDDLTKSPVVKE